MIAEGARVTAMLVNRYFGSKEQWFGEVVAEIMSRPIILTGDQLKSASGSEEMAEALVTLTAPGERASRGLPDHVSIRGKPSRG